jgi:hypothetical protein
LIIETTPTANIVAISVLGLECASDLWVWRVSVPKGIIGLAAGIWTLHAEKEVRSYTMTGQFQQSFAINALLVAQTGDLAIVCNNNFTADGLALNAPNYVQQCYPQLYAFMAVSSNGSFAGTTLDGTELQVFVLTHGPGFKNVYAVQSALLPSKLLMLDNETFVIGGSDQDNASVIHVNVNNTIVFSKTQPVRSQTCALVYQTNAIYWAGYEQDNNQTFVQKYYGGVTWTRVFQSTTCSGLVVGKESKLWFVGQSANSLVLEELDIQTGNTKKSLQGYTDPITLVDSINGVVVAATPLEVGVLALL